MIRHLAGFAFSMAGLALLGAGVAVVLVANRIEARELGAEG